MRLGTKWITLRLAVVAAAVLLSLAAAPSVSLASDTAGNDVSGTTVGEAAAPDTLPPAGTTALPLAGLQPMDNDHDGWWDSGWWIVMPIMMVIFWGGVIAVAVWGIRQFTRERQDGRSPLDIAKERLARGEINKEEFEQIRSHLV